MAFHKRLWALAVLGFPWAATAQTQDDLFDDSVLHEVRITMPAADWQTLKDHYLDNTYYTVTTFQWTGAPGKTLSVNNISVRSRGHGSRYALKPGLHVDFNRNVPTQTFLGLSELDLKSNTQDPSLLHERISMELFTKMGVPASREVSTRVYVNGEYIGLYNTVESPDPQMLKRVFNDSAGYLYEYKPGDWNGVAGYHFEYLGPDLEKYSSGTVPTPFDPQNPHQNAPDTVTLEAWIRTMNTAATLDDTGYLAALAPYLDPKPFLVQVAVETYLADFDCILGDVFGLNNFFLYRFANKTLNYFIAWDKDNAFDYAKRPVLQNADKNVLMRRLMAIPELKNYYLAAVLRATTLAGGANGFLRKEALRMYNQTHQAALDDKNKTFLYAGVLNPASNDQYEAAVAALMQFPADRAPFIQGDVTAQGYQAPGNSPVISDGGVISAAALEAPAPGGLASIYGANFGDAKSTTVLIDGFNAPVLFASSGQLNVEVPWEASGVASVTVSVNGLQSNLQLVQLNTYSPGVFIVTHANNSVVAADNPATAGETLVAYCTGLGPVNGPMVTGQLASTTQLQGTIQNTTASVNNQPANVQFAGFTPGFIGLYQVNVQVPAGASGNASLAITVGGATSPAFPLPVR